MLTEREIIMIQKCRKCGKIQKSEKTRFICENQCCSGFIQVLEILR